MVIQALFKGWAGEDGLGREGQYIACISRLYSKLTRQDQTAP
jgi:hypothetical protein